MAVVTGNPNFAMQLRTELYSAGPFGRKDAISFKPSMIDGPQSLSLMASSTCAIAIGSYVLTAWNTNVTLGSALAGRGGGARCTVYGRNGTIERVSEGLFWNTAKG